MHRVRDFVITRSDAFPLRRIRSVRRPDLSAEVAQEQGARRGLRAAGDARTTVGAFCRSLPNILAAADFKAVVARDRRRPKRSDGGIVWGLGAHVIKTGLGPVLIDLMERGFVSAIATNGAAVIHDFEIALAGATSEDVDEALGPDTSAWRTKPAGC